MIYLDNNELTQNIYIPRSDINRGASPEYATKTELENAIENEVIRADGKYATKTDLIPYATTGWVISQDYVNSEEMESAISVAIGNETARTEETYQKISSMSAYSTTNEVEGMIDNAVSGKMDTSAMSAYSTTEEVEQLISAATDDMATETWVNSQGFLTEHQSLSAYSTTEQMNEAIDDAVSGKVDTTAMTAYYTSAQTDTAISNATSGLQETLVSGTNIKTINGESILGSGNIEIQGGGSYSAGTNIDITDNVISVTGITVPTKLSDLDNDEGFITSDALSGYSTTQEMNTAIDNAVSGKQDTSAMTQYYTSGETDTAISNATSGLASQSWVENKGYLTGYTESDPVFMASAASGITAQDITNWNAVTGITVPTKLSELENDEGFITSNDIPTSNTAFTNDAGYITEDALSGYAATSALTPIQNQINEVEEVTATALDDLNDRVDEISGNSVTTGTVESMITAATSGLQETLVSGTNIKTINNESILGSGNITIQGGAAVVDYNPLQVEFQSAYSYIDYYELVNSGTTRQKKGRIAFDTINGNTIFHSSDNDKVNWTIPTSGDIQTQIDSSISGKVDTTAMTQYATTGSVSSVESHIDEVEEVTADALNDLNKKKLDVSVFESSDLAVSHAINDLESRKVASNDVRDIVKMSQNDYDSLSAKSATTLYIII